MNVEIMRCDEINKDIFEQKEELKKAIEFIRKVKRTPADRSDNQVELFYEEELNLMIGFANEITKELQEENAELKEKLEIEQNARGDWFGKAVTKDRRLTEAKEILRKILSFFDGEKTGIFAKAEAFLKE